MLQAAFGGFTLLEDGSTVFIDPLVYHESGFNIMSPLEFSVPKSDSIFILIRKRDLDGTGLEDLLAANLSVSAKDATNGELLAVFVSNNSTHEPWNDNPSSNTPVLLKIQNQLGTTDPILRVRVIDCEVKDTTDNSFINFRIIVDEDPTDLHFNYIPVSRTTYTDRNTFTDASRNIHMTLGTYSDTYIIVSPSV